MFANCQRATESKPITHFLTLSSTKLVFDFEHKGIYKEKEKNDLFVDWQIFFLFYLDTIKKQNDSLVRCNSKQNIAYFQFMPGLLSNKSQYASVYITGKETSYFNNIK